MATLNGGGPAVDTRAAPADRNDRYVTWAERFIAAATVISTAASFYESFSGLVGWFQRVGFTGFRAYAAPAMIDLVALVGETLALVIILKSRRARRAPGGKDMYRHVRWWAWAAIAYGLALSVAGNAGRDGWTVTVPGPHHTHITRLLPATTLVWNAVPPVSMGLLMTAVLAYLKLSFKEQDDAAGGGVPGVPEELAVVLLHFRAALDPAAVPDLPTVRMIKDAAGVGTSKAMRSQAYLKVLRDAQDAPLADLLAALDGVHDPEPAGAAGGRVPGRSRLFPALNGTPGGNGG